MSAVLLTASLSGRLFSLKMFQRNSAVSTVIVAIRLKLATSLAASSMGCSGSVEIGRALDGLQHLGVRVLFSGSLLVRIRACRSGGGDWACAE